MLSIYYLFKYWIKYSISKYSRYKYLFLEIYKSKPTTLIEIGVYKGIRSLEMLKISKSLNYRINFYGFDLFENITDEKIKKELSKKSVSAEKIKKKLLKNFNNKDIKIRLIKGDTIKTLKKFKLSKKADFIFIDGGHSLKTIKSDWKNIKKLIHNDSIIIFDDYYDDDKISKKFGCKKIIDNLDKTFRYKLFKSSDFVSVNSKMIRNHLVKVEKIKY